MRVGSRALVVRCAFFRASLVPFPIPLQLRAGCSGGDYATSGVSCRKEKYIRRPFDISPILELVWQSLSSYVR